MPNGNAVNILESLANRLIAVVFNLLCGNYRYICWYTCCTLWNAACGNNNFLFAVFTVYTAEDDIASVSDALTEKGYKLLSAQVEMIPQNGYIKLSNEDEIKNMQKMLDLFEDNDDVQNVWHNWEDAE